MHGLRALCILRLQPLLLAVWLLSSHCDLVRLIGGFHGGKGVAGVYHPKDAFYIAGLFM